VHSQLRFDNLILLANEKHGWSCFPSRRVLALGTCAAKRTPVSTKTSSCSAVHQVISDRYGAPDALASSITIPAEASFADMVALKENPDIGNKINTRSSSFINRQSD